MTISEAFYLGKYKVTQKQWHEVMGYNQSYFKGDDLSVENVSWDDVQEFIKKLNEKESTHKYRLPSEAEWEYAWYSENSGGKTHPVGKKGANPWGLYDVHGNIWEWVQDEWHNTYNGAPSDGSAWEDGVSAYRVFRGGSWPFNFRFCRSASRARDPGVRLLQEV